MPREITALLIQFVIDLFLSTFRDHHSLQARVERILALTSKSKCGAPALTELSVSPGGMALQLEEILAAPLVIPHATATLAISSKDDDVHVQTQ